MAFKYLKKTNFDQKNPNSGSIYYEAIEVLDTETSDEYILPISQIYAIAAKFTGTGTVYFTNDSPEVIEAGNAEYEAWDTVSAINLGITGFKVESTSGTVTLKITVKSAN
jgi:hypothetical protein